MYMVTRGNSMVPLIKLSEGYSYNRKHNFVTCVCGSNGEMLKPIKLWDEPFDFFNKEKLTAEFISKTELVYVMITDMERSYIIDIIKYRLPDILINNTELEFDAIRRTKPNTENMLHIEIDKNENTADVADNFLKDIANGNFKNVVRSALWKFEHKDHLCYGSIDRR